MAVWSKRHVVSGMKCHDPEVMGSNHGSAELGGAWPSEVMGSNLTVYVFFCLNLI